MLAASQSQDHSMHGICGRLQFSSQSSQPSQPTASQFLNTAFGQCHLGTQSDTALEEEPMLSQCSLSQGQPRLHFGELSQQQQVHMGSQSQPLCTPDYITPQDADGDQQFTQPGAAPERTPAMLEPNRFNKRPRSAVDRVFDRGSQASQPLSQSNGGFAAPQPRVVLKKRAHSPPCMRNVFLNEGDEGRAADQLPRAPPPASRYRAEFKELRLLGQGNFSRVYLARGRLDGCEYAVKRSCHEVQQESLKKQWVQEVHAIAAVPRHPNVVGYYAAWIEQAEHGEMLYMQLERCWCSLSSIMTIVQEWKEQELVEMLRQVASALKHLHDHNVAHMDVKPDNIYTVGEEPIELYKLGDFGLAVPCSGSRQGICMEEGDSRYIPAEILRGDYSQLAKADMFMLGITLYELTSRQPLPTGGSTYSDLRTGRQQLLVSYTAPFQKMIKSLMAPNPEDRPSATKVLSLPLLTRRGSPKEGPKSAVQGNYGGLVLKPSRLS